MQNGRLFEAVTLAETVSRKRPRAPLFFEGQLGPGLLSIDPHFYCAGH
jgi:hypothetical protein